MSINFSSQKPNALIIGGTGKIGRHLVRFLLNRDFIIKILTRNSYNPWQKEKNVKIIKGNLLDKDILKSCISDDDYVFHLAAYQNLDDSRKELFSKTNVLGTELLLDACLKKNVKKLIYVSSTVVFENTGNVMRDESWSLQNDVNLDYYAATKLEGLIKVREFYAQAQDKLPLVIVFPPIVIDLNNFSSSAPASTFLQRFIWEKVGGGIPGGIINLIGKGSRILNYVVMDDLIRGLYLAAVKGRRGEEYILGGENITAKDYLKTLATRQNKKNFPFRIPVFPFKALFFFKNFLKLPHIIKIITQNNYKNGCFSSRKAERELGYIPKVKL